MPPARAEQLANVERLTSGGLLARNTLWNLLGTTVPMAAAIVAIPPLIRGIGLPRFGVLTLVWMVVGYFGLFDLGLGTSLTRMIADRIAARCEDEIPSLFWTAISMMLAFGLLGTAIIWALAPVLVQSILKIPPELTPETVRGFRLLALVVPVVITSTGLRGTLEAHQRFAVVNAVRIPLGLLMFAGPLVVLPFTQSLLGVIAVLVVLRILGWIAFLVPCLRTIPALTQGINFQRRQIRSILTFGGWITVSNIIWPLMMYADRFLIGAQLSVTAVAFYTTPFEIVSKLLVFPAALASVLFPAFTMSYTQDRQRLATLLTRGVKYVSLAVFPLVLILTAVAREGLELWLGADFARQSTVVAQWLAAGVFINCLAQLPAVAVQGAGRPEINARLHMLELPLYVAALFFMVKHYGITGAAIAWTMRVALDATLLTFFAERLLPPGQHLLRRLTLGVLPGLTVLYVATLPETLLARAALAGSVVVVLLWLAWFRLLEPQERHFLVLRFRSHSASAEMP